MNIGDSSGDMDTLVSIASRSNDTLPRGQERGCTGRFRASSLGHGCAAIKRKEVLLAYLSSLSLRLKRSPFPAALQLYLGCLACMTIGEVPGVFFLRSCSWLPLDFLLTLTPTFCRCVVHVRVCVLFLS